MAILKKKISPRRKQVRENIAAERFARASTFINSGMLLSLLMLIGFVGACSFLLSTVTEPGRINFRPWPQIISIILITTGIAFGISVYIYRYNHRIVKNHIRAFALSSLLILLLAMARLGYFFPRNSIFIALAFAVTCAIILTIAYDQRFAIGISIFFAPLICFAIGRETDFALFLIMAAGIITSCFLLKEIRTRTKLLEVGVFSGVAVFGICFATGLLADGLSGSLFKTSGWMAAATVLVGIIIQALLPLVEKSFRIATSMTLLDYSDANQPLLKRLAMEAPGTFSHSLLIGSIAETAAEAIGANGLLCRVGAYYHDIGKIGKPRYFVENQMGTASRHDQLSPAMSQLIIVGHVKDGIEMAKEYRLPAVIRQFIETHHGTTLIEYFYAEAKKKTDDQTAPPSESEFRYPGPRPQTKEAAIVMLADAIEGAVRSLTEVTPTKIETVVHNMAMKRLQDGQFDECELTLRELSRIEDAMSKSLAAHHHGRIAYPKSDEEPEQSTEDKEQDAR
ncbi:MAG: HDIG domain-containing protein [Sedimentisphaerales bacterium]|nr:HDIG domain-containing protein [Sedimentisphaerales bacterium]